MKSWAAEQPTTILITPTQGWAPLRLKDLWEYRELLYFLVWRDVKVSYTQTVLGVAWVGIKPVLIMVVFTVVFGWLVEMPSDGAPYPIFAYTALLPWQLFSRSLSGASTSLVGNQHLITKVYFPRLVVPLSAVGIGVVDFAVTSVALVALMGFYHVVPSRGLWLLPAFMGVAVATALGVGLWLSALNVRYRDVAHAYPFLTQIWLFATPVIYPSSLVPEAWRMAYWLNPMVSVIEGFRWALLGTGSPSGQLMALSTVVALVVLVSGLYYFRRMERNFADMV